MRDRVEHTPMSMQSHLSASSVAVVCGADAPLGTSPTRLSERYQHGSRAKYALSVIKVESCPAADTPPG